MPVSHIGLTVSHLPTSCSFFLSALQPLGYRFIGQQGNQIGLGIRDADFFLCQETPGVKAGAAHIAFTAPSRAAVRDFYTAALTAGGRPNGAPASRTEDSDHFNAAVLDFDGNSVEVVFRNEPDIRDDGTVIEHSRVLTWQRSVAGSIRDDRSIVSSRASTTSPKQVLLPTCATALSKAPSIASKAASMVRSISEPVSVPGIPHASMTSDGGDGAAKKIIGTLLGAAAGAAVAYAMCKSEQDSAKKEAEFEAFQKAKATVAQAKEQSKLSTQDPQPIYEIPPKSIHRNISDADSYYSTPQHIPRAIEPAPGSYHSPTYTSVPPTQVADRPALEYVPTYSVAPSRTQFSVHRSFTSPEIPTVSKARSVAPSAAPSTLISSFVPEQVQRRSSEGSVVSHHSSKSKAKSSHTHVSKHTSVSKPSKSHSTAPSPPPTQSKATSIVGSILGRDVASSVSKNDKHDYLEIEELDINDSDTVAPSDSISNAGSSSRRSRRRHKSSSKPSSVVSKHSDATRHSKSSKHSHRSHRSSSKESHHSSSKRSYHSSRHHDESPLSQEWDDVEEYKAKPSVISEPSDASTVKPAKSKVGRKDSVAGGQYDQLFPMRNENWGSGTVASLPIRGITPSMIQDSRDGKKGKRSVISYAH